MSPEISFRQSRWVPEALKDHHFCNPLISFLWKIHPHAQNSKQQGRCSDLGPAVVLEASPPLPGACGSVGGGAGLGQECGE